MVLKWLWLERTFIYQVGCKEYFLEEVADRYNVKGWVRNLPDGRVEAVLEGDKESVEKVIKWAHRGSIWSRVEKVEVIWEEYKGEYDSFKIIYYQITMI